jgi:all-trans-retinol 13,14-reductase
MYASDTPFTTLLLNTLIYTTSAAFPKKGMHHFIDTIYQKLVENGVDIFLSTEIIKFETRNQAVSSVVDKNGNHYEADLYVSNIDPQETLRLCDFPIKGKFKYKYTHSCYSLYLGLKNINLADYKLGNFNVWYFPSENVDSGYKAALNDLNYESSWLFISTPSAHVSPGVLAPEGCSTMQVVAPANYTKIADLKLRDENKYNELNQYVKESMLNVLSKKFISSIRDYVEVEEFWSPLDLASKVKTPCGAIYGMPADAQKLINPVGQTSPFPNLYFVGATSTVAGLGNVLIGSMNLYNKFK